MADTKPFGDFIPIEELTPTRPAGRGRQRDTYFEETGFIQQLTENVGRAAPVFRDSQGELPKDDTEAAKKRRQSVTTKIRRSLKVQELAPNLRPVFRTKEGVLYAGLSEVTMEELEKRQKAAEKRAKARAR